MLRKNYVILILFVLLLALGTAADVFFWKQLTKETTHENRKWQNQWQALSTQIQQQQNTIIALQNQFNQLIRNEHMNHAEEVLSETGYLIDLANLYLQTDHNIPNAIKTLSLAQQHVHDLQNPQMNALLQALASDINQLNSVSNVDPANVLLQLQQVGDSINRLSFLPNRFAPPATQPAPPAKHWWQKFLNSLRNLFVIQYHSSSTENILAPDQREYIQQNINFTLRQAEWAVLQEQPELYQNSLKQIQGLLSNNYMESETRNQVLAKLNNLAQINIQPKIPPLTRSMQALSEVKNKMPPQNVDEAPAP